MSSLLRIQQPVKGSLEAFSAMYQMEMHHTNPLLRVALEHVLKRGGKLMRPTLLLLSAREAGRWKTDAVLHAAVSLEMLHTACLVHDDVVDESDRRRGQQSVNALMDNKSAVLVGDYLLSTSLRHAALTGCLQMVERVAWLGQALSDGELHQLSNVSSSDLSEGAYFEVIRKKTASLFAICAEAGALLGGAKGWQVERARILGENIGICFQLRDDIFDYYKDEVGKPTGNDMKEGKLTLPVLYAVSQPGADDMRRLALKVRDGSATEEEIALLVDFTKRRGGIEYAYAAIENYRLRSHALLEECSDSRVAEALRGYVDFVVDRTL
ncbi:MAG: polyprenyl synthetase family protein [Clostridium sp.]|nr:polyprenyl synthetase family protein [Clostridium sp.]